MQSKILILMTKTFSLAIIFTLSISLAGCGARDNNAPSDRLQAVYTFILEGGTDQTPSTYSSTMEEGKSLNVGFKTGGQIKRLTVNEGAYVRKGQIIGYLDDADYSLQVRQIETQFDQLTSEMKRIEEMYHHNNISQNDYEKAVAGLEQLRLQLTLAKNNLAYTRLEAPTSGYVVEKFMEEGELVGSGTPVYKIVDNSSVEASVALSAAAYAQKDKIVRCVGRSAVTGDREIPLDILSFIPDGDNNSLFSMRLKVNDPERKIIPGMNMTVEVFHRPSSGTEMMKVPSRALFERNGKTYVWEINRADSTLTAREVTLSGAPEGKWSMVSGLPAGSEIVAVGVNHLSDNQKVKIKGKEDEIRKVAL